MRRLHPLLALPFVLLFGCASQYTVPGGPADLSLFLSPVSKETEPADGRSDREIAALLARRPSATFPAGLALARVQAPDYSSATVPPTLGAGAYTVLAVGVEEREVLARVKALPMVSRVDALTPLLAPSEPRSDVELRRLAARLHAQVLLIYTLDTRFVLETEMAPLTILTLGLLSSKTGSIRSTASAVLIDTQTGFLYGAADAAAEVEAHTSAWSSPVRTDEFRREAETAAFRAMIGEFARIWERVLAEFAVIDEPAARSGGQ
jgi:hypothetical protein